MQQTIITTLPLIPPFRSLIIHPAQLSLFRSMDISFDRILTQRPSSSDLDDPLFYTTPTTYSCIHPQPLEARSPPRPSDIRAALAVEDGP